jgi:hypothetical protein
MARKTDTVTAYKAFAPDFTCRGHAFEAGKTYTVKGKIEAFSTKDAPAQIGAGPDSWRDLAPEEQARWRERALQGVSQKRAEKGESMRLWFQNAEAMAKSGNVPQGAPSFSEAVRVYGAERGPQMWQQGQQLVKLGQNMGAIANDSDQGIQARIAAMAPAPSDQEMFAVKSAAQADLARAAETTIRERRKNPVEWAITHNPEVAQAATQFDQAIQDPKATPEQEDLLHGLLVKFLGSAPVNERTDDDKTLALALWTL